MSLRPHRMCGLHRRLLPGRCSSPALCPSPDTHERGPCPCSAHNAGLLNGADMVTLLNPPPPHKNTTATTESPAGMGAEASGEKKTNPLPKIATSILGRKALSQKQHPLPGDVMTAVLNHQKGTRRSQRCDFRPRNEHLREARKTCVRSPQRVPEKTHVESL